MSTISSRKSSTAKKPPVNKKLLYVLGVVLVVVFALKMMPGLLGGGGTHAAPIGASTFHFHKTPQRTTKSGGTGTIAASTRDPFAPPPGYEGTH